jgi:Peptidase family S41
MKQTALLLLLAALTARAQDAAPSPPAAPPAEKEMDSYRRLEELDAGQIKLATDTLRSNHAESAALDETGMARATLRGLLEGLYPGAELDGGETAKTGLSPFRSEILDGRIGYVRLGSIGPENLGQLDAALEDFTAKKVEGLVLDLRATPRSEDFPMAVQICERFVPEGTALFSMLRPSTKQEKIFTSSRAPAFRGAIVLLADGDDAGAAEAIAAALRRYSRAMIVGTNTSGRAVEFAVLPLGGGHHLRYAVAEVRVAGLPPLYPRGVEPDLEVAQSAGDKKAILDAALDKGIAGFVSENERTRMNEAALVAGTNPEIGAGEPGSRLIDRPLQRAVDLVTAIKLFRKGD